MAVFSYSSELEEKNINVFSSSSELEEKNTSAYNDSSAIYIVDEDYGSISESPTVDDDYGTLFPSYNVIKNVDYGTISIVESLVPYGTIDLSSFGQIKLTKFNVGQVTFAILGQASIFVTPIEFGGGKFTITGDANPVVINLSHVGSGTFSTLSSSTESVGITYPESTILFRTFGNAIESSTDSYLGSGSIFALSSSTETISLAQEAKVLFEVSGTADQSKTTIYIGSGSLFGITGSSESITPAPEVASGLFRFVGAAEEQFFRNNSISSSGIITLRSETQILIATAYSGDVLLRTSGKAQESITPTTYIGSGSLFTFVGSSESVTVDPVESIVLFKVTGQSTSKLINSEFSSGQYDLNGSATAVFKLLHVGSGQIEIGGSLHESVTPAPHIGSGTLFNITGSTDSITVDPVDKTTLFTFYGSASEKFGNDYRGYVDIDLNDSSVTKFTLRHIGSGSLFGFSSATESVGSNPPESTALFRFSGLVGESSTASHTGSGSLFSFISYTESAAFSERFKGLFRISGSGIEKNTESYVGSGSLFEFSSGTESSTSSEVSTGLFRISGNVVEKRNNSYLGSGSLFGFSSTTEATGSNPPESIALFKVSGFSDESFTPAPHIGSGSIFTFVSATETRSISEVSVGRFKFVGSAVEKNTESYVGSGTLFGITGSFESITPAPEIASGLFKFVGAAEESITPAPHIGSGSIFTFISFTETVAISPDDTRVLFAFSGEATNIKKTDSYLGTGSLFGITGSFESITPAPEVVFALFRIIGRGFESFGYPNYDGLGISQIEGAATSTKIEFESAKPTRIILI